MPFIATVSLVAALLAPVAARQGAPGCPPAGWSEARLATLKSNQFAIADAAQRRSLALAMTACLADPNPALRDGIAFEALTTWLRAAALDGPTVRELRDRLLPFERLLLCALGATIAALCLVLGWRRPGLRWAGALVLVPTLVVALDLLWFAPQRPAQAIALQKLALVSEPRAGLEPVATVRAGVTVDVLGSAEGSFVRAAAGDRSGYAPRDAVAIVQ